jgi:glycosylphosphatidylinositol deacylase
MMHTLVSPTCKELHPSSLKLIPNPSPEKPFPVPHEGVDESEGVVLFEAPLPGRNCEHHWVAVAYSTNKEGGWILGGFVEDDPTVRQFNVHGTYSTTCYHAGSDESAYTCSTTG